MKSEGLLLVLLGGLGFLPLFGGPRYEAALLAGLIAPAFASVTAAFRVRQQLRFDGELLGREIRGAALRTGLGHIAVILLVATAHGVMSGFCEPAKGYGLLLLGPSVGVALAACFGAGVSVLPGRPPGVMGLLLRALSAPLATALFGLWEFYSGPEVYAFDPFVGYLAGPLYDTVRYDLVRLSLFRLGTVPLLVAFWSFFAVVRVRFGTPDIRWRTPSPPRFILAGLLVVASAVFAILSPRWGLATTEASIERTLSGQVIDGACRVIHSKKVAQEDAARTAGECAAHLRQIRPFFGLRGDGDEVAVLLFASAEEKWQLMGARSTYIAKPWRREIYIQNQDFPHSVLGHELAHIVAGEFGKGPFRVAGALGGWIPDPGRIEGFAVASAPPEQGEATETEWSAAMLDIDRLPPVRSLFTLGFLGQSAVRSYTASGAFVSFLHRRYGPAVLRSWYGGGQLIELTGQTWSQLDADFREHLTDVPVPSSVRLLAAEMFTRPAVWGRRCPHAAERKFAEVQAFCPSNPDEATAVVKETLLLDGTRVDDQTVLPACFAGAGRIDEALEIAGELGEAPELSQWAQSRAKKARADLLWVRGDADAARQHYLELKSGALSLSERRAIQVKLWAMEQDSETTSRIQRVLALGAASSDNKSLLSDLGRWVERGPHSGVFAYLLGLRLAATAPHESRRLLEEAVTRPLPSNEIEIEAYRRLLVLSCQLGDGMLLQRAKRALLTRAESGIVRRQAQKLSERCTSATIDRRLK